MSVYISQKKIAFFLFGLRAIKIMWLHVANHIKTDSLNLKHGILNEKKNLNQPW